MVLLVVLVGLYLIAVAGYYKFSKRMGEADPNLGPWFEAHPRLIKSIFLAIAPFWPVAIVWFLFKEAVRA